MHLLNRVTVIHLSTLIMHGKLFILRLWEISQQTELMLQAVPLIPQRESLEQFRKLLPRHWHKITEIKAKK